MGIYVAERVIKLMTRKGLHVVDSRVLILGLSFKENCPDLRNTGVIDIIRELESYHARVEVHDPWVSKAEALEEYGLSLVDHPDEGGYDAVVLTVGHEDFRKAGAAGVRRFGKTGAVLFDVKSLFTRDEVDGRL